MEGEQDRLSPGAPQPQVPTGAGDPAAGPGANGSPAPDPAAGTAATAHAQAKPPRRGRGCCLGCLAVLAALLLGLGLLAWWVSRGPAPAPADCLPPDAPVQIVMRDPAGSAGRFLGDARWRAAIAALHEAQPADAALPRRNLPGRDELAGPLFLAGQILGDETALAAGPGRGLFGATRPGLAARAVERLARGRLQSSPGVRYGLIGRTLVFSDAAGAAELQAVLARRDEILAAPGTGKLAAGLAGEVRIRDLLPAECGAGAEGLRLAAFMWDLPSVERISGVLRLDRALEKLSGHLYFPPEGAGQDGAPSAAAAAAPALLPAAGPASARLVPDDALAYWVWNAPEGDGRWSAAGRMARFLELFPDMAKALDALESAGAGAEMREMFAKQLAGERAIAVCAQAREGGKPLMAAATLMFECRDPDRVWPQFARLLGASLPISTDGNPPREGDLPVYPHLVQRSHRGTAYLETVYAHYPHGSGYRPAYGLAGRFLVAASSRAELERMIDRAGAATGRSLASRPEVSGTGAGGARLSSLLVVRPGGRGRELSDLGLALAHAFSESGKEPGQEAAGRAAALGEVLSLLKSLRAEWQPGRDGSLRIEIAGEIAAPAGK